MAVMVVAIMVIVCRRHGLWPSWLWPSWSLFVAVMVCGCHCRTPHKSVSNASVVVCSARTLSMLPGYDLENVKTLRSLDDAQFIASHSAGKDVVIVGTSFIGRFLPKCVVHTSF